MRPDPFVATALLLPSVAAAAPDDAAVTSVGAELIYDQGLARADFDPMVGERLRWTLADGGRTAVLLADARFTLDPAGPDDWEQQRVRSLEVQLGSAGWTVDLGRSAVAHGGPRLVDGLQVLHRSGAVSVGGWVGLAPDPFTTAPRLRLGGGPIVAWEQRTLQASAVGEVSAAVGGLDRVALLILARYAPSGAAEVSGRLDTQLDSGGVPGLSDGSVFARWRPARSLRVDALYDAYSSLRYLQTADLDPDLQRFAARTEAAGLTSGITGELPDPSVYQLVGLGGSWQAATAVAPRFAVTTRYRYHPRPQDRYARIGPAAGLLGLLGGRLDGTADLGWTWQGDSGSREDLGVTLVLDPLADGRTTFDGSVRLLVDPAFGGKPGWYADLFVDLLVAEPLIVVAGASATEEPFWVPDASLAGFVWVQHRLRGARAAPEGQVPIETTRLP